MKETLARKIKVRFFMFCILGIYYIDKALCFFERKFFIRNHNHCDLDRDYFGRSNNPGKDSNHI